MAYMWAALPVKILCWTTPFYYKFSFAEVKQYYFDILAAVDKQMIVIGSGIASQHDILEPRLQSHLQSKLSAYFMPKQIRCATLGNQAGMVGALRCFLDEQHKASR